MVIILHITMLEMAKEWHSFVLVMRAYLQLQNKWFV